MHAATVAKLSGKAFIIRGSESIPLTINAELLVSDAVRTEAGAKVELRFTDGAIIDLGPSTEVQLKEFAFDPAGASEPAFVLNMLEGAVRSVSGKVVEQNPEAFKLHSPKGLIGIRGTTTLHFMSPEREVHIVETLDKNHIVLITTTDGRTLTLTGAGTGVTITGGDFAPLTLDNLSPEAIQDYVRLWLQEGNLTDASHSILAAELSALIVGLADMFISGRLGIDSLDGASALVGDLGGTLGSLDPFAPTSGLDITGDLGNSPLLLADAPGAAPGAPGVPDAPAPDAPDAPVPGGPAHTEIAGTDGPDTLHGDAGNNWIYGYGGNDLLYGYAGDDVLWGGTGADQLFGGRGSFDILVKGSLAAGDVLSGDGTTETNDALPGGLSGDHDIIIVGAAPSGYNVPADPSATGVMAGGAIYGDAREMGIGSIGGNDSITVQGDMSGGAVYGDAENAAGGFTGGNDAVTVQGSMSGGEIHGDTAYYPTNAAVTGGNDVITVRGDMSGGIIISDVSNFWPISLTTGGNDAITVGGTMSGGAQIQGGMGDDAISVGRLIDGAVYAVGGTDVIHIGTADMSGGYIDLGYDADNAGINTAANTKTLQIDAVNWGSSALQIDCGNARDLITISGLEAPDLASGTAMDIAHFDGADGKDTLDLRALDATERWSVSVGSVEANPDDPSSGNSTRRAVTISSDAPGESISVSFIITGENLDAANAILI